MHTRKPLCREEKQSFKSVIISWTGQFSHRPFARIKYRRRKRAIKCNVILVGIGLYGWMWFLRFKIHQANEKKRKRERVEPGLRNVSNTATDRWMKQKAHSLRKWRKRKSKKKSIESKWKKRTEIKLKFIAITDKWIGYKSIAGFVHITHEPSDHAETIHHIAHTHILRTALLSLYAAELSVPFSLLLFCSFFAVVSRFVCLLGFSFYSIPFFCFYAAPCTLWRSGSRVSWCAWMNEWVCMAVARYLYYFFFIALSICLVHMRTIHANSVNKI